ncbi:MAG TPA: proline dehydrogenase family protein [Anseongella sp.]
MFDNTEIAFSHFDDKELKKAWWLFKIINNNFLVNIGPPLTLLALKLGLPVVPLIRSTIFEHFCGGETIEDCEDNIAHLWEYGVGTILDYSVEGEKTEAAFDATADEIISTIGRARKDNKVPFSVFKITGLGHFELLEQVAFQDAGVVASGAALSPNDKAEFERLRARVDRICGESFRNGIPVLIDAEESWIQDTIDSLALEMMEKYNREKAIVYNTYQLYRTDRLERLKAHTEKAASQGFCLGVKLVRGAYMEKERDRAEELNKPSPIHPNKAGSDRDFDAAAGWCLDHIDQLAFMAGTHNEESCRLLVEGMAKRQLAPSDERIYFAQLLGMSDNISFNLAHQGYRVAKYMPYGPVRSVLPYLFRRAQENTAMAGQMGRELRLIVQELRRRKAQNA